MALTINSQASNLFFSNSIARNDNKIASAFQKLSSGLAINKASDGPAKLVISNQLRAQITGLDQAVENTQRANNILGTAEGGLSSISGLLTEARSLAVEAANTGGLDSEQTAALQGQLNSILSTIDRVSNSTSFAGKQLLNGEQAFTTANVDPAIENLSIDSATAGTVSVDVTAAATQATAQGNIAAVQAVDASVLIQGSVGSAEVQLSAGQTQAEVEAAINAVSDATGVSATGGQIVSTDVGSNQTVTISNVSGQITGITEGTVAGTDIAATVNGAAVSSQGNTLNVSSTAFTGDISFAAATGPGNFTFDVTGGGASFQLGANAGVKANLGIGGVHSSQLGSSSGLGSLSSLISGGTNSLANNPSAAVSIIDSAISQVSTQRASIGSFQSNILDSNTISVRQEILNITDSESRIRDTDFALQISDLIKNQLLQKSTIAMGTHANTNQANILSILGS